MEYAIETFSLTKIFSDWWGRNRVCAVDELNLQIRSNEVFGLLGPNGSGKTTTIKMLLGLLYPTKGRAVVLGGDSTDPKISAKIGFLPEESYLYKYLNARETLDFYGKLFNLPSNVRKMRIESLLEMVGLQAVANRPIGTFSKGMARRIGLAQALINDPEVLILDEPTSGLDPIGTKQMKDLFLQLAERGKTILLCSHLLADVEDVCDRIAIMYGGKIQTQGKVNQLLEQTNKIQITAGSISDSTIEKVKQLIGSEQSDCVVNKPMDKLESFFIRTVTKAGQQNQATSGAVARGDSTIADFLASKSTKENVLDKLVCSSASNRPSSQEMKIEPLKAEEKFEIKPDEDLLSKLTEQTKSVQTEKPTKTEPVQPAEEQQAKENILDKLTNRNIESNEKQNGNSDGDAANA